MSFLSVEDLIAAKPDMADRDPDYLQDLIDANEVLVAKFIGGPIDASDTTVTLPGYPSSVILLPDRAAEITSVTEHWRLTDVLSDVELDPTDWRMFRQGTAIERLEGGVNSSAGFADEVIIEYVPFDQRALRKLVIEELCEADVNYTPGISSQRLGDYSETKSSSQTGQTSITSVKNDILGQLAPALPVFY